MLRALLFLLTLCLLAGQATAQDSGSVRKDVLLIDRIEKTSTVQKPARGMTMDAVRAAFGEPKRDMGTIGEPPITRWEYENFTVYFEDRYVINAVINKATDTESRAG